jgi:hypothetical protein
MSRFSAVPHGTAGQVVCLPDKEFRLRPYSTTSERTTRPCVAPSLHVAMQMGPSHDPVSWTSGVWSLGILLAFAEQSFLLIVRTRRIVTAPSR